ncbi:MAG: DNA-binding domain-containing protein [Paracoccaceae bacterium]
MTQGQFLEALMDANRVVPEGLVDAQGRPAGKRFSVYRNNVVVGLTGALETGYPVVRRLLGEEFFAAMVGVYLRAHPPLSRMMMLYGDTLPEFLETFQPVAHLPYLPDVARLELRLRQSYHSEDRPALSATVLANLSPAQFLAAKPVLAPAVQLVRSLWPIHAIWRMNTENDAPPPAWHEESVLILRPEFDPAPHLLPSGGGIFVSALLAGATLGSAIDQAGESHDLTTTLSMILRGGGIVGFTEGTQ